MNEGWICPRCRRVNAPFITYCDCEDNIADTTPNPKFCNHSWECVSINTAGVHYICTKCGATKNRIINSKAISTTTN